MNNTSAADWKHMYFFGITRKEPNQIDLSQDQIRGLLSVINVNAGISTGAAIDPKYLINAKGTTAWLALYALIALQNPEAINEIKDKSALLYVPSGFLNSGFANHNNWPSELLSQYNLNLEGYKLFAIPFLVPAGVNTVRNLSQSLKAPDGSLEVFGVQEFNEAAPEALLAQYDSIVKFIVDERPDVTAI